MEAASITLVWRICLILQGSRVNVCFFVVRLKLILYVFNFPGTLQLKRARIVLFRGG